MNKRDSRIDTVVKDARPFWEGGSRELNLEFAQLIQRGGVAGAVDTGWPDFALFGKDGSLRAVVEVKTDDVARGVPTNNQAAVLIGLASLGLPCFIWSRRELLQVGRDRTIQPVPMTVLADLFDATNSASSQT